MSKRITISLEVPDDLTEWPNELCLNQPIAGCKIAAIAAYDLFALHDIAETTLARIEDTKAKLGLAQIDKSIRDQVERLKIFSKDF